MTEIFQIFKTKFEDVITNKKSLKLWKKFEGCSVTPESYYTRDGGLASELQDSIAHSTNAEELHYLNNGKKHVFLPTHAIEMLMRAKFTLNKSARIEPIKGWQSFAVSLPKGASFTDDAGDVVKLNSCLVTIMRAADFTSKVFANYKQATGHTVFCDDGDDVLISIAYHDSGTGYHTCVKSEDVISSLINGTGERQNTSPLYNQQLNEKEQKESNAIFKLITALCIYNSATNCKNMHKGYPSNCEFKMPLGLNRASWNASFFEVPTKSYSPKTPTKAGNSDADFKMSPHIRTAHLRNLQNERYYQGDFKNVTKGARWILVEEYDVGDIDANHLKTK